MYGRVCVCGGAMLGAWHGTWMQGDVRGNAIYQAGGTHPTRMIFLLRLIAI